jgi:four helix bundle protein
MQRSAVSIPSNIAEGRRRGRLLEFKHFLRIAFGSGGELETQIIIAKRLGYGNHQDYKIIDDLLNEVMRILNTMIK